MTDEDGLQRSLTLRELTANAQNQDAADQLAKQKIIDSRATGVTLTPEGVASPMIATIMLTLAQGVVLALMQIWNQDALFLVALALFVVAWYYFTKLLSALMQKHSNFRWVEVWQLFFSSASMFAVQAFIIYAVNGMLFGTWTSVLSFSGPQTAVVGTGALFVLFYFSMRARDNETLATAHFRKLAHKVAASYARQQSLDNGRMRMRRIAAVGPTGSNTLHSSLRLQFQT
jgi:signal transduction histidine kinase